MQAESGLGLADQRRRCEAMCDVKGWQPPVIYADEGISGTKETRKRPALARMMEAVRRGEIDAVIVLDLSRLARKTRLVLDLVEELNAYGVAFISCKEQLDTSSAQGQFVLTMFAALGQLERDLISERTIAALAELNRQGDGAGRMPYGYRRAGKSAATITTSEAANVRRIFALQRRGESTRKIAARLNADGIPAPRGGKWHHTSVQVILGNRAAYSGGTRGASQVRWPAIIGKSAASGNL